MDYLGEFEFSQYILLLFGQTLVSVSVLYTEKQEKRNCPIN